MNFHHAAAKIVKAEHNSNPARSAIAELTLSCNRYSLRDDVPAIERRVYLGWVIAKIEDGEAKVSPVNMNGAVTITDKESGECIEHIYLF